MGLRRRVLRVALNPPLPPPKKKNYYDFCSDMSGAIIICSFSDEICPKEINLSVNFFWPK
jgi:hypothetical protein